MPFTVIFLTAWFLLAGGTDAHAGFIVPLFGAIGSLITGLGALGQLLVGIALKVGLSLLAKAMQPKPKEPGIQGEIQTGGDNPLSFIMGHFATAGQLEYINTWGNAGKTPNAFLTHVVSLSDVPLHALTGLWVNDRKVTLPTMSGSPPTPQGWPVVEFRSGGTDYLWIKFHDGSQSAADTFLVNTFVGDAARPWKTDQIGRGVAYVVVTARVTRTFFPGIPAYMFETSGCAWYDVRKDTTAGGSGSHRWADKSTWEPSNNPAVHVYNLIRGVSYGSERVYGGQTTEAYQLPAANWMAAANACDESIDLAGGGTEPRYRSGCQITADQEPASVIESLLKGCSGRLAEVGGRYKIAVGAPGAAVYSFTDEQVVVTEGQSLDPFPGLEATVNGAQASYPEPEEKWAPKDAPAYLRPDLEILDDNRRLVPGLQFPTVPYAVQVQRLLKEAVEDSRRFKQHQLFLPPEAWLLEPNDVVSWTSGHNSYVEKKFIVVSIEGGSNFLQLVLLKEVDPSDFSWDPETDEQPYSVGPLGPIMPAPQAMTGWQAFPAALKDADGTNRRPSIEVRFDGDLDDIEFVRVQVRLVADGSIVFDGVIPYGNPATNADPTSVVLNGTFLPKTNYEVRGIFESVSGREMEWSSWLPVLTDDIRITDITAYLESVGEDVYATLQQLRAEQDELRARMEVIAAGSADATGASVELHTVSRRFQNATAVALREMTASITETEDGLEAMASIVDAVAASVGDISADGLRRIEVVAGTGDVVARLVDMVRATTGDDWVEAGVVVEVGFTGGNPALPFSRIVYTANQFVFADPGGQWLPVVIDGGVAYFNNARIKELDATNIKAGSITSTEIQAGSLDAGVVMESGTVITDLIAQDALTKNSGKKSFSGLVSSATGGFIKLAEFTCDNPNPTPVNFLYKFAATLAGGTNGTIALTIRIVRNVSGTLTPIAAVTFSLTTGQTSGAYDTGLLPEVDDTAPQGTYTYELQYSCSTTKSANNVTISNSFMNGQWWLR